MLFSVVCSSTPRLSFVNWQLVCLLPCGYFNLVTFIQNICFNVCSIRLVLPASLSIIDFNPGVGVGTGAASHMDGAGMVVVSVRGGGGGNYEF